MKTYRTYLIALAAIFSFATFATAQTSLTIITVDMARLYENYHKTEEAQSRFEDVVQRARADTERLMEEGNTMVANYRELLERTNNPALSDQARLTAQREADELALQIREKENDLRQFQNATQRSLEERQDTQREMLLDEIMDVVMEFAREREASLVFDTSGPSLIGLPAVLYADDSFDITEAVLEEINRNSEGN
ncbi:MAG: OmpH family outer membrane protein [Opitutales bacterium]